MSTRTVNGSTTVTFADTATATSTLPVTYASDNTNVATVATNGTVTIQIAALP